MRSRATVLRRRPGRMMKARPGRLRLLRRMAIDRRWRGARNGMRGLRLARMARISAAMMGRPGLHWMMAIGMRFRCRLWLGLRGGLGGFLQLKRNKAVEKRSAIGIGERRLWLVLLPIGVESHPTKVAL